MTTRSSDRHAPVNERRWSSFAIAFPASMEFPIGLDPALRSSKHAERPTRLRTRLREKDKPSWNGRPGSAVRFLHEAPRPVWNKAMEHSFRKEILQRLATYLGKVGRHVPRYPVGTCYPVFLIAYEVAVRTPRGKTCFRWKEKTLDADALFGQQRTRRAKVGRNREQGSRMMCHVHHLPSSGQCRNR